MYYTIDAQTFAISIFNDGEDVPFQFQPDYPNLDKFDSYEEAETWAKLQIKSFDENEPYAPDGKNLPGTPKPTAEEINANLERLRNR
jgi:hypothetical protein